MSRNVIPVRIYLISSFCRAENDHAGSDCVSRPSALPRSRARGHARAVFAFEPKLFGFIDANVRFFVLSLSLCSLLFSSLVAATIFPGDAVRARLNKDLLSDTNAPSARATTPSQTALHAAARPQRIVSRTLARSAVTVCCFPLHRSLAASHTRISNAWLTLTLSRNSTRITARSPTQLASRPRLPSLKSCPALRVSLTRGSRCRLLCVAFVNALCCAVEGTSI